MTKWEPGDRVTRTVYSDDGTWQREGDACLPYSPLYQGSVVRRSEDRDDEIIVVFDGTTTERHFLDHGVSAEAVPIDENAKLVEQLREDNLVLIKQNDSYRDEANRLRVAAIAVVDAIHDADKAKGCGDRIDEENDAIQSLIEALAK